jgi:hypothetical protein
VLQSATERSVALCSELRFPDGEQSAECKLRRCLWRHAALTEANLGTG